LNYMTEGVVAVNEKGAVIHLNPAARDMLGDDFFSLFPGGSFWAFARAMPRRPGRSPWPGIPPAGCSKPTWLPFEHRRGTCGASWPCCRM
jgi:PAS domain-containing protein